MSDEIACPKCAKMMARGFIPESSHATIVSFWVEGEPESSFWSAGIKIPEDKVISIVTYRCIGCGFLESYARK
jgi:hypothetical protein